MSYTKRVNEFDGIQLEERDASILKSIKAELAAGSIGEDSPIENELSRLESKYLSTSEAYILRSLIPEANIESITFETNRGEDEAEKEMLVKIVYSISDVVEGDAISQWFDDQNYEKYFLVRTELAYGDMDSSGRTNWKYEQEYNQPALESGPAAEQSAAEQSAAGRLLDSSTDSNIVKFKFEKTYILEKEPDSLNFLITTTFDIDQLERDFDADLFSYRESRDFEKSKKIVVLSNGNLQYPVQDFRIREELKKFTLSEERKEAFAFLNQLVETKRKLDRENSTDFFSDFWITRNGQGEAKFVFIFDVESFFEKRSEYREFYKRMTNQERKELKREIFIPSFRVNRKRVRVVNSKGSRSVIDFSDEYSMFKVVETSKSKNRESFNRIITEDGAIMQINISGTSEKDLIFLTGTDYNIATATDGLYAYGVSVDIIDTMKNFLLKKLEPLNREIISIKNILNESTINLENYNPATDLYLKPLREIAGRSFSSAARSVRDVYQLFAARENANRRTRASNRRDIKNKINNIFDIEKIKSPKELEMLIELMETMMRNALQSIGEPSLASGRNRTSATDIRISSEKFYTKPNMIFDANVDKLKGIDYLTTISDTSQDDVLKEISSLSRDNGEIGIKVIDGATWENRATEEIAKFFAPGTTSVSAFQLNDSQEGDSNISLTGTGSEFYTMSYMSQSNNSTQTSGNGTLNFFQGVNTDFAEIQNILVKNILDFDNEEIHFLSGFGVVFGDTERNITLISSDFGRQDSSSRGNRSPDVDYGVNLSNLGMTEEEYQEQKDFEQFVFSKMVEPLNNPGNDYIDSLSIGFGTQASPQSMPNVFEIGETQQQKSEIVGEAPNQVISYSLNGSSPDYVVSQRFLSKIQFLKSFETDEQGESVSTPIWEALTIDTYKNNANRNLLCRIDPYQNEKLGIRTASSKYPIYDSFFAIKPVGYFSYEYEELIDVEAGMVEVLDATAARYQEELQQIVGDKYLIDLIIRQEQQRYLETSLNPRLQIVKERNNYRTLNNWTRYTIERDQNIRRYTEYLTGFDLDFMITLSNVESGQVKLSEEGGWNSPRNTAQIIEDSTQNLRNSYQERGEQSRILDQDIRELREEIEEQGYDVNITTIDNRPVVSVKRKGT